MEQIIGIGLLYFCFYFGVFCVLMLTITEIKYWKHLNKLKRNCYASPRLPDPLPPKLQEYKGDLLTVVQQITNEQQEGWIIVNPYGQLVKNWIFYSESIAKEDPYVEAGCKVIKITWN